MEYAYQMSIDDQSTSTALRIIVSDLEVSGMTSKRPRSLKIFRGARLLVRKSEFRMTIPEVVKLIGR
jgi:hypothetical protein